MVALIHQRRNPEKTLENSLMLAANPARPIRPKVISQELTQLTR